MLKSGAQVALSKWSIAVVLCALVVAGLARPVQAQTAALTKQEQDAIQVVNDWNAAWSTGDAEKVGEFMSENCVFRLFLNDTELRIGRAEFVKALKQIFENGNGAVRTKKAVETYAVGGENGTAVMQRRVDTVRGQERIVPVMGFFRVKDGQIQEWLDMLLVSVAGRRGGAAAPGGAGAPGGVGGPGNGRGQ